MKDEATKDRSIALNAIKPEHRAVVEVLMGEIDGRNVEGVERLLHPYRNHPELAPLASMGLAWAALQEGRFIRFIAYRARAAMLAGRPDENLYYLGVGFEAMGRTDRARQAYEHALAINPRNRLPRLGLRRVSKDRLEDAVERGEGNRASAKNISRSG